MRALIIAVALALATPAWAGNVEEERELERTLGWTICLRVGGDSSTCAIKYLMKSEADARAAALRVIETCDGLKGAAHEEAYCPRTLAYIKQRWGY